MEEIVKNYAVDGIQFDDYFYPTTDEAFDAQEYAGLGGGPVAGLAELGHDLQRALEEHRAKRA